MVDGGNQMIVGRCYAKPQTGEGQSAVRSIDIDVWMDMVWIGKEEKKSINGV